MTREFQLMALISILLAGCSSTAPPLLELSEQPVTKDGLHEVVNDKNFVLYMAPDFAERARQGEYRGEGKGVYVRSCNVTFADSDQEALMSRLQDRMQEYLCQSVKDQLDERGVPRIEEAQVTTGSRIIDVWLLHVSIDLPEVSSSSSTNFIFSGVSEEMTFGWVTSEAGTGSPLLRYYQRARTSHAGHYLGDGRQPQWSDVRGLIDSLSENAVGTLLPIALNVTRQAAPGVPMPE
jgi:hypothetical protein